MLATVRVLFLPYYVLFEFYLLPQLFKNQLRNQPLRNLAIGKQKPLGIYTKFVPLAFIHRLNLFLKASGIGGLVGKPPLIGFTPGFLDSKILSLASVGPVGLVGFFLNRGIMLIETIARKQDIRKLCSFVGINQPSPFPCSKRLQI